MPITHESKQHSPKCPAKSERAERAACPPNIHATLDFAAQPADALSGVLGCAEQQLADMMSTRLNIECCEKRPEPSMRKQLPSRPSK